MKISECNNILKRIVASIGGFFRLILFLITKNKNFHIFLIILWVLKQHVQLIQNYIDFAADQTNDVKGLLYSQNKCLAWYPLIILNIRINAIIGKCLICRQNCRCYYRLAFCWQRKNSAINIFFLLTLSWLWYALGVSLCNFCYKLQIKL